MESDPRTARPTRPTHLLGDHRPRQLRRTSRVHQWRSFLASLIALGILSSSAAAQEDRPADPNTYVKEQSERALDASLPLEARREASTALLEYQQSLLRRFEDPTAPPLTADENGVIVRICYLSLSIQALVELPKRELIRSFERAIPVAHQSNLAHLEAYVRHKHASLYVELGENSKAHELLIELVADIEALLDGADDKTNAALRPCSFWVYLDLAASSRLLGDLRSNQRWFELCRSTLDAMEPSTVDARLSLLGEQIERLIALGRIEEAARVHDQERALAYDTRTRFNANFDGIKIDLGRDRRERVLDWIERIRAEPEQLTFRPNFEAELSLFECHAHLRLKSEGDWYGKLVRLIDTGRVRGSQYEHYACRWACFESLRQGQPKVARRFFERWRENLSQRGAITRHDQANLSVAEVAISVAEGGDNSVLRVLRDQLRTACDALLNHLEQQIPIEESGSGLLYFYSWREPINSLINLEMRLEPELADERSVAWLLRLQASGTLTRERSLKPGTVRDIIESLLGEDEGVLLYLNSTAGGHVYAIDRGGIVHGELPDSEQIIEARQALLMAATSPPRRDANSNAINRRDRSKVTRAQVALGEILLPHDVAERVAGWKGIVVSGGGILGWVPFAVLRPKRDQAPLGMTHAIRTIPSVAVGIDLARSEALPNPDNDLWTVASPIHSEAALARWPESQPLKLDATLLEKIGNGFSNRRRRISSGRDATPALLKSIKTGSTETLLVITHGVYDPNRTRPAGLILAPSNATDDGLFWCRDADDLTPPAQVILAVCGAGRGNQRMGDDGVQHFGGAFLRAGARTIILSRANLDVDATLALIDGYLRHVALGASPAEAMRRARNDVAADPQFDHPYFHSLFEVFGS